jgi:hypothetical protein
MHIRRCLSLGFLYAMIVGIVWCMYRQLHMLSSIYPTQLVDAGVPEMSRAAPVKLTSNRPSSLSNQHARPTVLRSVSVTAEANIKRRHFLTQNSTVLPVWFKNYVVQHRAKRLALTENNWKDQRFLIMRCLVTDDECGGAADRLASIPTMIMVANKTDRMLFIKWNRPAPLQEFLVPPEGGLDWTIPDWIDKRLNFTALPEPFWPDRKDQQSVPEVLKRVASDEPIMTVLRQLHGQRFKHYNQHKDAHELGFHLVSREFWDTLFTPSAAVAALIQQNMKDLNLVPGKYVAAHMRTLYEKDESNNYAAIHNGINCATQLKPGWPVYFASDSSHATLAALEYGRSKRKNRNTTTVVARVADTEPLHLDRGIDFLGVSDAWKNLGAAAFYDTFVDVYLLAGSQCLAFGAGGYGMWGAMLSQNSKCSMDYSRKRCGWTD